MAAFFPPNSGLELGYGIVAALIFSAYILVDTQLVMRHYQVEEEIGMIPCSVWVHCETFTNFG